MDLISASQNETTSNSASDSQTDSFFRIWRAGYLGWLLALIPLAFCLFLVSLQDLIAGGQTISFIFTWIPSLGVNLSWQIDGLSLLFGILITGIGALIFVYVGGYLSGDLQIGRLYLYLLIFMVAMLGLVFSANLLTLFIFWELTSITSYLLIGHKHGYVDSRRSALQALLVTGGGGLALLVGILLLGQVGDTFEISELTTQSQAVQSHPFYLAIVLLVLAGAFTKSAQFPFHFWLPNAMAAPTPVSAYLHSATMVKAGVYLVARMTPILGGTTPWFGLLVVFGTVTMIVAAFLAWRQTDLKRILAYTTISALGMLMLLLGIGTTIAYKAALVFLIAHALYKGALFMVAGVVEKQTGTRDINRLGGLWRVMPLTATSAALAALSMSGLPPLTGFVSKELFYEATLYAPSSGWLPFSWPLTTAALVANVLTVMAAALAVVRPFAGNLPTFSERPSEGEFSLLLGPFLLAAGGLIGGLIIGGLGANWIAPAASVIAGGSMSVKLSLWHGINPMLILSAVTIGSAVVIWLSQERILPVVARLDVGSRFGPERSYSELLEWLPIVATRQTQWLQNGYLRAYLFMVMCVVTALVGMTLLSQSNLAWPIKWTPLSYYEIGILATMLGSALLAVTASSRLMAIVSIGVVGLGMSLLFVFYSAPDLAMTQFAVETLTVLLFVFVLYRLPHFRNLSSRREKLRDAGLALLAGSLMSTLVIFAMAAPHPMHVSEYFADESWLSAKGRNVVNVILVDFRALDTLGEIVVLIVAALGVQALMRPLRQDISR